MLNANVLIKQYPLYVDTKHYNKATTVLSQLMRVAFNKQIQEFTMKKLIPPFYLVC